MSSKISYYIKVELSDKFTEKEVDDLISSIQGHIGDWHYEPDKPIVVKKVTQVSSQSK